MNHKIKGWVIERLQKAPSAEVFILFHSSVESLGGGEILLKRPVGDIGEERKGIEDEADSITSDIVKAASDHAEAFNGFRQRYKVVAESEDEGSIGSFPFVKGSRTENTEVGISEPATEKGVLGQFMRHNESLMRINSDMMSAVLSPLITENQSLRKQRDDWEGKRLDAHLKLEELLSEKHIRDIELADYEKQEARKDAFWNAFLNKWGPEIIKRFKINGAPAGALKAAEKQVNGNGVETYQSSLRDIFKVLDRNPIYESLDDEGKADLDNLLGLGDNPETPEAFKEKLIEFWSERLPDEVCTAILDKLSNEHPDKGHAFLGLMGMES